MVKRKNTNKETDIVGKFALILTAVGFVSYFILGSGVFNFRQKSSSLQADPETNLKAKVNEWRKELNTIAEESTEKKKELEDLTSRLARIRLEVQKRNSDLSKLIAKESKLARGRTIAGTGASNVLIKNFNSISELQKFLNIISGEEYNFTTQKKEDGSLYQNVSMSRPFAEDSIYLRRAGIRWAQAVSKAAVDLKANDIIIRYAMGDVPFRKAQVLQEYLVRTISGTLPDKNLAASMVALEEAAHAELTSESQVDLVLGFKQEAQRSD
jgi:hypothetical protein